MNSLSIGLAGGAGLISNAGSAHLFDQPGLNLALKKRARSVLLVWLAGGASQFETFDPKQAFEQEGHSQYPELNTRGPCL